MEAKPLETVSDYELLERLAQLVRQSRRVESEIVWHIAEVDGRRLYAREACPSMFAYCIRVLHLSEAEAYLRITAARASRKHPALLNLLGAGQVHLTGIALLAPHSLSRIAMRCWPGRCTSRSGRSRNWSPRSRLEPRSKRG